MKFDISITTEITPEIIHYIKKGLDKISYCTETLETIEKAVVHNQGTIYTIKLKDELFGIIITSLARKEPKNLFTVFLLSGKDMALWQDQYHDFIIETIRLLNARLIITGCKGWKKIFPELKEAGMIYTFE